MEAVLLPFQPNIMMAYVLSGGPSNEERTCLGPMRQARPVMTKSSPKQVLATKIIALKGAREQRVSWLQRLGRGTAQTKIRHQLRTPIAGAGQLGKDSA